MSGFEIAGIILGGIPLVISALEHYQAGKGVAASIRNWKGLLNDLIFRLKLHRQIFYLHMVELLREARVKELVGIIDPTEEQCVTALRNTENEEELKQFLGSLHGIFVDTIKRYEACLQKIAERLERIHRSVGAANNDLAAFIDANTAVDGKFHFRKRLNFAISRRSLSVLVDQLKDDRLSLKSVIEGMKIQQQWLVKEAAGDSLKLADYFEQTQKHARTVFMAIREGYTCSCPQHHIFLRLQHRLPLYTSKGGRSTQSSKFHLVVELEGKFQDTVVEAVPDNTISHNITTQSAHNRKPKVSFQLPVANTSTIASQHSQDPEEVTDVCLKINGTYSLGSLLSLEIIDNKLWYTGETARSRHYSTQMSLSTFFKDSSQDDDAKMTPKQKTILALDVATSVLQLNSTSWFHSPFDSTVVQILPHSSSSTQSSAPAAFIEQVIEAQPSALVPKQSESPDPNVALLELAIVLLEIWHHKTFEMWASKAADGDLTSESGRMAAAIKWLRMTYEHLPPDHLTAIEHCFALSIRPWRWSDPEFRRLFCENVVKPLDKNVRAW